MRLYRGEALDFTLGGAEAEAKIKEVFGATPAYAAEPCRAASLGEIEAQGWSRNPGRYVGGSADAAARHGSAARHLQKQHHLHNTTIAWLE